MVVGIGVSSNPPSSFTQSVGTSAVASRPASSKQLLADRGINVDHSTIGAGYNATHQNWLCGTELTRSLQTRAGEGDESYVKLKTDSVICNGLRRLRALLSSFSRSPFRDKLLGPSLFRRAIRPSHGE